MPYKKYQIPFKLKVISYAKMTNNVKAAERFKVNRSLVIYWRKQEGLLKDAKDNGKKFRALGNGRKVLSDDADAKLLHFIKDRRSQGCRVS